MAILCVIDGMTDEGWDPERMPHWASLARRYGSGWLRTLPEGCAPDTAACLLTLLGVPAAAIRSAGRAWLDALGLGLTVDRRDLLLRITWTSLLPDGRTGGPADAPRWAEELPGYHPITPATGLLFLPGRAGEKARMDTHPPHLSPGAPAEQLYPTGLDDWRPVWERGFREGILPVPWGEAAAGELPARPDWGAVTATGVVRGLSRAMGIDWYTPAGATGGTDTDLQGKLTAAMAHLGAKKHLLLHIEGADSAAHRLDAAAKSAFLSRIDRELLPALAHCGQRVLITADHGTSPLTGAHLAAPQPFLLLGGEPGEAGGILPGAMAIRLMEGTVWQ